MKNSNLKKKTLPLVLAVCLLTTSAVDVLAHHPIQAKFDTESSISLSGIVTNVDWSNPHIHVYVNVSNGSTVQNWAIEQESPISLKASGWNKDTLKPGDKIDVTGPRARNGTRQVWGSSIKESATGRIVYTITDSSPVNPLASRPAPLSSDGMVALGMAPGGSDGYWGYPSEVALVEDGVSVSMDKYGQLTELKDAAKVAPLQPWALGLYSYRQQNNLQSDPMFINCKPPGGPRQYQSDLGFKLVEDKVGERVFVMMGSGNHNYRIIYLDGRDQSGQVTGDDDNPLFFGRSVGKWEGDTLVVNTTGFNEDFWFSNGGLPHTSMLTLHEKFSRPNLDTFHYEVMIEDPGAYTRNWSASWDMQWVGGEELPVHFCQDNRP